MSKYIVDGTDMTSVANAIRTKGGTSASLEFPSDFVSAIGAISGGGSATLITKSITENGTYNASSDSADGYSSVTVALPQKYITGTFTGTTEGQAVTVTIPYTGSGYLIALFIYPSTGMYKSGSAIANLAKSKAVVTLSRIKQDFSTAPTFSGSGEENKGSYVALYKSSNSDASAYAANGALTGTMYTPDAASTSIGTLVRINSNTQFATRIVDSNYGFAQNIEYTYLAVYSS